MSRRDWPEEVVKLPPGEWVKDGHTLKFVPGPDVAPNWTENPHIRAECGTYAGYSRHRRDNTPTCDDCKAANRERVNKDRPPTPRKPKPHSELTPHGTHAAFNRHKKHGEEPCDECRAAENDYQQQWRNSRKDAA